MNININITYTFIQNIDLIYIQNIDLKQYHGLIQSISTKYL